MDGSKDIEESDNINDKDENENEKDLSDNNANTKNEIISDNQVNNNNADNNMEFGILIDHDLCDSDNVGNDCNESSQDTGYPGEYFEVSTMADMVKIINDYMETTSDLFVCMKRSKNFGKSIDELDLKTFRIQWSEKTDGIKNPRMFTYDGLPQITLGHYIMHCQYGEERSRARKEKRLQQLENSSAEKKSRKSQGATKTVDCPAKIFTKHVIKFPDFKITTDTPSCRSASSKKLRECLINTPEEVKCISYIKGKLPYKSCHQFHNEEPNKLNKEPIDVELINKVQKMYFKNQPPKIIREKISDYVLNHLFYNQVPPDRCRRKYYPSRNNIKSIISRVRLLSVLSLQDISDIKEKINAIKENVDNDGSNLIVFRYYENSDTDCDERASKKNENKSKVNPYFTLIFQTLNQKNLLQKHGSTVFITEITLPARTRMLSYSMFVLLVQTNVDYQVVCVFVISKSYHKGLENLLAELKEVNASQWKPEYFIIDVTKQIEDAISSVFPDTRCLYRKTSCQNKWNKFLSKPSNELSSVKEELMTLLNNIAEAHIEDTLSQAANKLEENETWKSSNIFQEWFMQKWQSKSEKWIKAYQANTFLLFQHFDELWEKNLSKYENILITSPSKSNAVVKIIDQLDNLSKENFDSYKLTMQNTFDNRPVISSGMQIFYRSVPFHLMKPIYDIINEVGQIKYEVKYIAKAVFELRSGDENVTLSFGNNGTFPCCNCTYWFYNKRPCIHMLYVMLKVPGWSFETLSPLYLQHSLIMFNHSVVNMCPKHISQTIEEQSCQVNSIVENKSSQTDNPFNRFITQNNFTAEEASNMAVDIIDVTSKVNKLSHIFQPSFAKQFSTELQTLTSLTMAANLSTPTNNTFLILKPIHESNETVLKIQQSKPIASNNVMATSKSKQNLRILKPKAQNSKEIRSSNNSTISKDLSKLATRKADKSSVTPAGLIRESEMRKQLKDNKNTNKSSDLKLTKGYPLKLSILPNILCKRKSLSIVESKETSSSTSFKVGKFDKNILSNNNLKQDSQQSKTHIPNHVTETSVESVLPCTSSSDITTICSAMTFKNTASQSTTSSQSTTILPNILRKRKLLSIVESTDTSSSSSFKVHRLDKNMSSNNNPKQDSQQSKTLISNHITSEKSVSTSSDLTTSCSTMTVEDTANQSNNTSSNVKEIKAASQAITNSEQVNFTNQFSNTNNVNNSTGITSKDDENLKKESGDTLRKRRSPRKNYKDLITKLQ